MIERAPLLNPRQLLQHASQYRQRESTRGLATHLATEAMKMIISDSKVNAAISKIKNEPMAWSFFGDIWGDIVGFFTGTNPNQPQGSPITSPTPYPCAYKCVGFGAGLLLESCATGVGDNYGPWHVIGICIGFGW